MKYFGIGMLVLIGLLVLSVIFKTCSTVGKFNDNLQNTVYEEFKPEELLRKYEWFKDASSQLEQKLATLKSYEARFKSLKSSYGADSTNRKIWGRSDKEQWNVWESEYLGIKSSYNDLAAQYNSAMSKFNYRFCNVGDLPRGADVALPREFKSYINE